MECVEYTERLGRWKRVIDRSKSGWEGLRLLLLDEPSRGVTLASMIMYYRSTSISRSLSWTIDLGEGGEQIIYYPPGGCS